MRRVARLWLLGLLVGSLAACGGYHAPHPLLQQGDAVVPAGDALAAKDLTACQAEVRNAAPVTMQPRWLPPLGSTEQGVVLGTADAPHPVMPPRDAYRQELERCLTSRGYQVRGWQ